MKKKLLYEVPEAELFLVRIEENILSGGGITDITNENVDDDSDDWNQ